MKDPWENYNEAPDPELLRLAILRHKEKVQKAVHELTPDLEELRRLMVTLDDALKAVDEADDWINRGPLRN